ncbi:cation-translocating P-type ATPase [Candidatus Woesearchaeota archaeon]|nr:cation-translocating P-type ATPase [Candidatus Woesearchaeota archaeon]
MIDYRKLFKQPPSRVKLGAGVSMHYHAAQIKHVLKELKTSENGISSEEAAARLKEYGPNELQKAGKRTALKILLEQFQNFLLLLLIAAGLLSAFLGNLIEAGGMFFIALISAFLGFIQEYRAEKAVEALRKIAAPTAKVLRQGSVQKAAAREIVQGDILLLEQGDIVAADARIIEEHSLEIDESVLTGESVPSRKNSKELPEKASFADQKNMAFMGTTVTYGKAKAAVTSTGMKTEFGKIAKSLQETEESKTPLQVKFEGLSKRIGLAVVVMVAVVFLLGLIQGSVSMTDMLILSISLAVASVPSALPAIVTISLALGANTMAKKSMIIKKLPATETLGSVTAICSDKTGTLTRNQMTVTRLYIGNEIIEASGTGYAPQGSFTDAKGRKAEGKILETALRIGQLCNNARLTEKAGKWEVMGDPTEGALIVAARKAGLDAKPPKGLTMVEELPFDSERKRMSVIYRDTKTGKTFAYVKGAPDITLKLCSRIYDMGSVREITKQDRQKILAANNAFAESALRVLALAYRELKSTNHDVKTVEKDLVFAGLAGMIDPPREEVRKAVAECKEAGIRVIIITGDHPLTTKAVIGQIGFLEKEDVIMTGEELDRLNDRELDEKIEHIKVIARALPIQKSRIVDALKRKGHIVAMTGDGVNDAPALKKADVGIAMGITGTDVAKEAAVTTLVDDNFASIVNAVEEGRNIYDKIVKSARYLLSCNLGEIVTVFLAVLLRFPIPMVPLQILLMNVLTDGLPAIGLGTESAEEDVMKRSPRNPKSELFTGQMLTLTVMFGIIMGIGTLYIFNLYLNQNLKLAQTVAFTTLVMFEMFAVVGSRSLYPLRKLNILTNKWLFLGVTTSILIQIAVIYWAPLQVLFSTTALSTSDWLKILAVSSLGFFMMELGKMLVVGFNRQKQGKQETTATAA